MDKAIVELNDRPGRRGIVISLVVALVTAVGYLSFPYPAFTPEMSEQLAVVAGLRPPVTLFPGLWRVFASLLPVSVSAYSLGGAMLAGVFALAAFHVCRDFIALSNRTLRPSPLWTRLVAPVVAAVGTLLIVFASPIRDAFAFFSPASLVLVILAVSIWLFESWVLRGGDWRLVILMFLSGLALAESPFMVLPLALMAVGVAYAYYLKINGYMCSRADFPSFYSLPFWRLFFAVAIGFILGVWATLGFVFAHGGLEAMDWERSMVVFRYFQAYVGHFTGSAEWSGWLLGCGLCLLPLAIMFRMLPRNLGDSSALPFVSGIATLVTGIVAYTQIGPFGAAWFSTWFGGHGSAVAPELQALLIAAAGMAFALALSAFAYDAFVRTEDRTKIATGVYCVAMTVVVALLLVLMVRSVPHRELGEILAFNDRVVRETVRELNGAERIFTDGIMDPQLELEAFRLGRPLYAIDILNNSRPGSRALCRRALTDEADLQSADIGANVLMRFWAGEREERIDECGIQLGFEHWKRLNQPLPPASALVARTQGLAEADVTNAAVIARALADEVVRLTPVIERQEIPPSVRRQFYGVSWRLSRFSRLRSDSDLANRLDSLNGALRQMLSDLEYERMRIFMQLTPREGLEFALKRADFAEASRYALAVLKYDKESPEANFALGMSLITAGRNAEAEAYLRKVLKRRPDEPAVLNNLSILCRKARRYDEALAFARAAAKLLPDNVDVKKTLADALSKAP